MATQEATPKPSPEQDLVAQYELGEEAVDTPAEPVASAPSEATTRPRDPKTGKFLPKQEEAPPEPAPEPAQPQHSRRVMELAKEFGLDDEEINATSPDSLKQSVALWTKQLIADRRQRDIEGARQERTERPTEVTKAPAEDDFALDPEVESALDPGVAKALKAVKTHAKELKELKEKLAQYEQRDQFRENQTFSEKMDAMFAKHGNIDRFGEGELADMPADSAARRRRLAVVREMGEIKGGSLEHKFKKALAVVYGEDKQTPKATSVSAVPERQQAWREGAVSRPTNRIGSPEPNGVKKAVASVTAQLAEMEQQEAGTADIAEDFLPGPD